MDIEERIRGCLLGTAVGDAVGLPAEGLKRQTIEALNWQDWRHRFFFGRGMISDDTEHALFVAQALLSKGADVQRFQRSLAWRLKFWLLGVPAGIGFGTLRSLLKLWIGFPCSKSGVFSAGNGPAMRSALFGVLYPDNDQLRDQLVEASTVLTHTDPRALVGARAVALCAALSCKAPEPESAFERLAALAPEDVEWQDLLTTMQESWKRQDTVGDLARALGLERGVSGYVYHTVPVAIYAWLRHYGDFEQSLVAVLNCGGDTDTVGAIVGAMAGAAVGESNIPKPWIDGICEYPRGVLVLRRIGTNLAHMLDGEEVRPVSYFWPALGLRNLFFVLIVLSHGFMRLIPAKMRRVSRIE